MQLRLYIACSSPSDWEKRGRDLFAQRLYEQALHCFEKAGLTFETTLCNAYLLRAQARLTVDNPSPEAGSGNRKQAFVKAAAAFRDCTGAASDKRKNTCLRQAAECYSLAGSYEEAGNTYEAAGEYTHAAQSYRDAALFDKCADILRTRGADVEGDVLVTLLQVCQLFYIRSNKLKYVSMCFFASARIA